MRRMDRLMRISTIIIRLRALPTFQLLAVRKVRSIRSPNISVLPPPSIRGMKKVVTAGMNTIDLAACGPVTKLLMSVLQFIGAAPGSTGGGVKVTTFAVLILTIRSVAEGRDDCVIAEHHIESKTVYRALTIIMLGIVASLGSAVVVYYNTSDAVSVIDAIFESCSAFGTVGLSVGVTSQLNVGAKLLYMLVMFMGRVGPVSLAISLTAKPDDNKRKVMPVGHINVG